MVVNRISKMGARGGGGGHGGMGGGGRISGIIGGSLQKAAADRMFASNPGNEVTAVVEKGNDYIRYDSGRGRVGKFPKSQLDNQVKKMVLSGRRVGIIESWAIKALLK